MIWGFTLLVIYLVRKYKTVQEVLHTENMPDQNVVFQEYLNAF